MTLHHVGCLVENISTALETYRGTGLAQGASTPIAIRSQKVQVCFLPAGSNTFIEFVQPDPDNSFLHRKLGKGINYYHVGYLCKDVETCVANLVKAGAHELGRFQSEAFDGRLCVFLVTSEQQMIELIKSA